MLKDGCCPSPFVLLLLKRTGDKLARGVVVVGGRGGGHWGWRGGNGVLTGVPDLPASNQILDLLPIGQQRIILTRLELRSRSEGGGLGLEDGGVPSPPLPMSPSTLSSPATLLLVEREVTSAVIDQLFQPGTGGAPRRPVQTACYTLTQLFQNDLSVT